MNKSIVKIYDYRDIPGEIVFQVIRYEDKTFCQRRPYRDTYAYGLTEGWYEQDPNTVLYYKSKENSSDKNNAPSPNAVWLRKVEPILYQEPELCEALVEGQTIFITEGEKDSDNLIAFGYCATTAPLGAGKWRPAYTEILRDARLVIILIDKDVPGRKHGDLVANELFSAGIKVKLIELPDYKEKPVKDISDWIEAGGTKEEFENLIEAHPLWRPLDSENSKTDTPPINSTGFDLLVQKFGEPFYITKKIISKINESFWAGLHNEENKQIFDPNERTFYRYDPSTGLYQTISEDAIKQEISSRMLQISRELGHPELERFRVDSKLTRILNQLKGIAERRSCFTKKPDNPYVHLSNGVIVFDKDKRSSLVEFSPYFFSRNRSPIPFDLKASCNRFLNELLYPAVHEEDALLIQKYVGLCLLGHNFIQRFLILDGLAGRGKSQLALVIQDLVGLANVTQLRTNLLHERFELYRYLKKTLLVGVDVEGKFLSERGALVIKGLTGGDWMDSERKGSPDCFPVQGNFNIIITSNSRLQLKIDGDMSAWRRRLLIVRFESPAPKTKIPDFAKMLIKDEGPGILNWALQGLSLLLEDIKSLSGDIYLTERQTGIVDALLAESDSLRYFLKECVTNDDEGTLTSQEIIERYAEFCPTKGWDAKPITVIHRELESLMLELFKTSKSNSISRNGKQAKGFRRVRFQ